MRHTSMALYFYKTSKSTQAQGPFKKYAISDKLVLIIIYNFYVYSFYLELT